METNQAADQLKVPDVGMRGGLGRILLTAFLVLAILPLSIISWYASSRSRLNIQEEVIEKLDSIAALKETQISRWVEEEAAILNVPEFGLQMEAVLQAVEDEPEEIRSRLAEVARQLGITDLALLSPEGRVEWASDWTWEQSVLSVTTNSDLAGSAAHVSLALPGREGLALVGRLASDDRWPYIAAGLDPEELARIMEETAGLGQTGEAYLVDTTGMAFPQGQRLSTTAVQAAIQGQEGQGLHENDEGVPVIGVYRWLPGLGLALFVEQSQEEALAGNDAVATHVIAMTLGVALATAVIAALEL